MDDLRRVQDLHGLAYDRWSGREEVGCCKGGALTVVDLARRLRRSKNNETGLHQIYILRRPQLGGKGKGGR